MNQKTAINFIAVLFCISLKFKPLKNIICTQKIRIVIPHNGIQ